MDASVVPVATRSILSIREPFVPAVKTVTALIGLTREASAADTTAELDRGEAAKFAETDTQMIPMVCSTIVVIPAAPVPA